MRILFLILAGLLCSCSQHRGLPVITAVLGEGDGNLVLQAHLFGMGKPDASCLRATNLHEWRDLRRQFAGAIGELSADYAAWMDDQLVAVPLPSGARLMGLVVSTEEGVDVLTVDVAKSVPWSSHPAMQACLLQLRRKSVQLAVVLRDQELGQERTLAVFEGL